jgi:hypothetical protein
MTIGATRLLANAATAAALLLAPGVAEAADAARLYRERTVVQALDRRCDLFGEGVATALGAAAVQARNAALRAGVDRAVLDEAARTAARQAGRVACAGEDARLIRARVEHAFDGWLRTPRLVLAGDRAEWRAERGSARGWRLAQASQTGASPVVFGLPGYDSPPAAVVAFVGARRPYAARLSFRDTAREARPALDPRARSARRLVWAARNRPASPDQLPAGARSGEVWSFPAEVMDQLAELDPRERFTVEFVFRDDSIARAHFEVGDIAAGRAFVSLGPAPVGLASPR